MDTVERLSKLKKLKIERHDGPLFKSPNDCMKWIDDILPLLKYDQQHYEDFYNHSQYVRITSLSSGTLMAHLDPMIGIVSQAITEIENNIDSPREVVAVHDATANPADKEPPALNKKKSISLTNIAERIIGGLLLACLLYLIATHFGLKLN